MRKLIVAASAVFSSLLIAVPAAADGPISLPPLAPGEVLLEVSGAGTVKTPATSATFIVSVATEGESEAAARRSADASIRRVIAAARAAGVAPGDYEASPIENSEYPVGDMNAMVMNVFGESEAGSQPSNFASATVTIRMRSAAAAPALAPTLTRIDGVASATPEYVLDDDTAARRGARADAIRRARADADAYAATLNMRVARVLRITERSGFDPMTMLFSSGSEMERRMEGRERAAIDGQIETSAMVGVDFALAP